MNVTIAICDAAEMLFIPIQTLNIPSVSVWTEKYSTVPIPGSEVSLDGAALRAEAQTEKDQLIEQLRANLEEVSNKVRYQTEAENSDNHQKLMNKVPINIYIG